MFIHQNVALHNVVELEPAEDGGVYLRRYPKAVRESLSQLGRMVSQESAGVEIRFVTEAPSFRLALGALPSVLMPYEQHTHDVIIFRGGFFHSRHRIEHGRINHVNVVKIGGEDSFTAVDPEQTTFAGFSRNVWRVFLGRYAATFHHLDTYGYPTRPPHEDEVPASRWLAYGSSITSGAGATLHHNSYVYHAARRLGLDVMNQGLSGSCHCEAEVGQYFAKRDDWQLLTLEVGVNMRARTSPEDFRQRVTAMLDAVYEQNAATGANRRVVLITLYPNSATASWTAAPDSIGARNELAYNEILRELAATPSYGGLELIEGGDVLQSPGDLTTDLVHPSDYGHVAMGVQLAALLGQPAASVTSA